jgi:F-type H+-transporting ATPase subunit a
VAGEFLRRRAGLQEHAPVFPHIRHVLYFHHRVELHGLLPTAGESFIIPTSVLSVTAALAIISFFTTHSIGISRQGPGGYLKSFLKPFAFLLPLTLLDQIVRPFSLALRLYGNIYADEKVTAQLRSMFPVLLPLVMQILSLLFCFIQAMVFTMLTAVYVHEAIGEDE